MAGEIPYDAIIADLNEKAGTHYRSTTTFTRDRIKARFAEGFTLEDFKTVHSNMVAEWLGTEWERFLRPFTLYSASKFEGYLNRVVRHRLPEKIQKNVAVSARWASGRQGQGALRIGDGKTEPDLPDKSR